MSVSEDNLRGDLEAALLASKQPVEAEEVETPVVESVEAETTAQERARDEKGRFAAKDSAAPDEVVEVGKKSSVTTAGAASGGQVVTPQPEGGAVDPANGKDAPLPAAALAPPNGWSAEAKAKWHELSPEVMAAVQKREQDISKFTSTRDEHASFGKEMYQTVQPYLATIKAEGGTPTTAIQALLNTAYVLRVGNPEQKKQLLLQTAREYGVDLGQPEQQQHTNVAPEFQTLQQEVQQLRGIVTQRDENERQRLNAEVQTELEAFAADPKNTHFGEVKGHMAALISQGAAKGLQDAYDQAVWARPETRATLLAQQRAEEEQKRVAAAKTKAAEARRKSIGITGGPGNTAAKSAPEDRSLRDELEANLAALNGAV